MTELTIPELSLVALVGCTGSGKSTFAHKHFPHTAIVSSDACRGIVSDDENDQTATDDAFALLHHIAGVRLRRGLRTVVDATNVQPHGRQELIRLAREHDVLPVAIVLDVPDRVCLERNTRRPERAHVGAHVVTRQQRDLRRSLRSLEREGFRRVYVLRGAEEIDAATVADEKLWNDRRELTGPFDVIGDVHGCRSELETLLEELGYALRRDETARPVDARHPDGRTAVFVGDLVDRGPDTPGVLRLVMGMVESGNALCVTGNHEFKLVRALDGRKVTIAHGLAESLAQLEQEDDEFRRAAHDFCRGLIGHYVLDGGDLVVAHAGLKQEYHGRASGRVRQFAMYGETTGETDEFGLPVRYPWAEDYRGRATVLYGHTPTTELRWVNNTLCLDTGAVFGGRLTALRYPERETVSVPAEQVWCEPARPLEDTTTSGGTTHRDPAVLDLDDVLGRRVVETRHLGRVSVQEENASAALEVMSRFAVDPRWLIYLPPTMSPCATADSEDLLEHPAQAFAYYRAEGVPTVVCQEKHMGSRAIAVVTRSATTARDRFGIEDGSTGALYTRTGRPFFDDPELIEAVLHHIRTAAEKSGLFEELGSDWFALDAELLPWSAKAIGLLRDQYAAVGAAARASLGAAAEIVAAAAARGQDVGELAARTTARHADADAFTTAYGRYCWPVSGLDGLRLAPFQLLAAEGVNYAVRDHEWHLSKLDALAAAGTGLFTETRRRIVHLSDPQSEAEATSWWTELTASGGEGMVVKPLEALTLGTATRSARPVQPGVKCRGPEYLRIIYGPEYLRPDQLRRLRSRGLGRKRSMALREYALGLESLDRFVAGEPLWRVHEAVFAVLALESEPVDPRL
ncbi:polynucleotide kinase-phosphatase [Nocardia macrotermitis]|uniref:Bis(5'-nucleosyl)-tetraphosphatase, symmetrical n=1 Tax=Nocardia macrotermitis TaxID=2585198 RepID=A0A7K0D3Q9_9NOCA|nr:polynucleotide kinase-phosphatase [Nocardia macrotermitis]MQY20365.1 Bis(5'-nucleosyl)-tetraphosphatase, symmetrical [Nocardia macrotermitis]